MVELVNKESKVPGGFFAYEGERDPTPTLATLYLFNADQLETLEFSDVESLLMALKNSHGNMWLNIVGLKNISFIQTLCEHFNIHPLVIEDILHVSQRPHYEAFDDYLFITLKMRHFDSEHIEVKLDFEQLSILLFSNLVITIQELPGDVFDDVRKRLSVKSSRLRTQSMDYFAYNLLDAIVDDYVDFVEENGDLIEELEDELIAQPTEISLRQLYVIKRRIIALRKAIQPMRDTALALSRADSDLVLQSHLIYFQDLYDHCQRLLESIDTFREMTSSILDIYLSSLNNKMNQTIRLLTIFATIFIPLTFITSLYGMNFHYMPELSWRYGYAYVWGLMLTIVTVLLTFFKRRKWF